MDPLEELQRMIEEEIENLERWANQTRTPMGQYTILGNEMNARAATLRNGLRNLKILAGN
ncbi:MAG: hypothetical protein HYT62_04825 [Candidatus Yanofskybacteria bacterium]|nr:hypothetical protein [Candidatus Yanofskybacteria bacterium]